MQLFDTLDLPQSNVRVLNLDNFTTLRLKHLLKYPKALKGIHDFIGSNSITRVIAVLPLCHHLVRLHQLLYKSDYKLWCYHKSMQYQATPLNTLFKRIAYRFNKWLSKNYDYGHIFISKAVKKNISEHLAIKNGFVIYNAVQKREVSSDLALNFLKKQNIERSDFFAIVPGRLHSTKGHHFLINSLATYIHLHSSKALKLCFVGGGPLKNELVNTIKNQNLGNHIFITDYVNNSLMLSFLALANLVVIPSIHEGFGNVAIEALMQGSTILASNTGGLPEIIKHRQNGFLFQTEDESDLKEKFKFLHTSKTSLNKKSLQRDFDQRFTLASQMKQIITAIS